VIELGWSLLFTVINVLILFLLLKRFLFKPVDKILNERQSIVSKNLADADEEKKKAIEFKNQSEKAIEEAEGVGAGIVTDARRSAQSEYDRILKEADVKAKEVIIKANEEAVIIKERVIKETEAQMVTLAIAAAAKIMGDQANPTTDKELYNHFLTKAGENIDEQN